MFFVFRKTKTNKTKVSGPIRPGTPNQNQNWGFGFCFFEKPKTKSHGFWFWVPSRLALKLLFFWFLVFRKTKNPNLDFGLGFGWWPVGPKTFVFWFLFLVCGLQSVWFFICSIHGGDHIFI